jgi:hypothetical protein
VGIAGKRLVFHQGAPNLLGELAIGGILFLPVRRGFGLVPVLLVNFGIVRRWRILTGVSLLLSPKQGQAAQQNELYDQCF